MLRSRILPRSRSLRTWQLRSSRAVAALEFALLAPIMMMVSAGLYDLTTAFVAWKRVNLSAQAIAEIATIMAATPQNTNQLGLSQAATAASAIYAYLPATASSAPPAYGVVISSVVMVATPSGCTTNCDYTPNVAWSGVFQGSGTKRLCGTLNYVSDSAPYSASTLPADADAPAPLLVVDVSYQYQPLFGKFITGPIMMTQSAYFSPRTGSNANWVKYYPSGSSDFTTACAGYSTATTPS